MKSLLEMAELHLGKRFFDPLRLHPIDKLEAVATEVMVELAREFSLYILEPERDPRIDPRFQYWGLELNEETAMYDMTGFFLSRAKSVIDSLSPDGSYLVGINAYVPRDLPGVLARFHFYRLRS